jgi:hypothetical protein
MQIIGAGFGRTGTLSLKTALEQLGFDPCAHMTSMMEDPERATLFTLAAAGDSAALDKAMDGCRATVDWPGTFFWRELVEGHPEAKVLLTVRDPEAWYASAERTIWAAASMLRSAEEASPAMEALGAMIDATVWEGTFHGRFADRDYAMRVFTEHNDEVRRSVPADRLLEYSVDQGWEPLCSFLGVPVPAGDFPRLNDTATFQSRIRPDHG